ncbi:MAG: family 16 glycoside hydrolase, partial [bacterium]
MKLLTASVIAFSTVVAFAEESKFTDLLTKGLEGWQFITKEGEKPADTAFKISDGILSTSGTPIGYLRTKETFKNYTLSFEWRWQPNTEKNNSGVLVHVSTP